MAESILNGKRILAVDDEPDVLTVFEEEIKELVQGVPSIKPPLTKKQPRFGTWTYELVILDIMGVRGFDLLKQAVAHNFPVVMLTAHALNPEALKRSIEMGARAYLPKKSWVNCSFLRGCAET